MLEKACLMCKESKDLSFFGVRSSAKDGYSTNCKDCINIVARAQYSANKEVVSKRVLNRYHSDKSTAKAYYQVNKLKIKDYASDYYKNNKPEFIRRINKRRAVKKNVLHEKYTEAEVFARWGTDCHICKKPIDLLAPRKTGVEGWELGLHLDHVVALKDGGSDTVDNVRPSHGVCNLRKH